MKWAIEIVEKNTPKLYVSARDTDWTASQLANAFRTSDKERATAIKNSWEEADWNVHLIEIPD